MQSKMKAIGAPAGSVLDVSKLLDPPAAQLKVLGGSDLDDFNNVVLNAVMQCLWYPAEISAEERDRKRLAALAAVRGFQPRSEVEAMFAAQAVAMHLAAMESFRRGMIRDQPFEAVDRLHRTGAKLSQGVVEMAEAIERRRGKAPQVVRVERVEVAAGGQAIVGNLTAAPRGVEPA